MPDFTPADGDIIYGSAIFPPNIVLVFQQPTTVHGLDSLGNPEVPVEPLIVVASLSKSRTASNNRDRLQDADMFQINLSGRAVTPKALPNTIKPGSAADATMFRVGAGFKVPTFFRSVEALEWFKEQNEGQIIQRGHFNLMADIGSRFAVQVPLGDKVEGLLTTEISWSEPA